jgi:hypothetical protein
MRSTLVAALLTIVVGHGTTASADGPAAIGRWTPPEGRFFDDALAVSTDGKSVAAVSTDAATSSTLHVMTVGEPMLSVGGLAPHVQAIHFLSADRLLVVVKDNNKLVGHLASIHKGDKGRILGLDKNRLGPAHELDVVDRDGKRLVVLYNNNLAKKGSDHLVTILAGEGLKPIAKRTLHEDPEGGMKIVKAGDVRPLWWTRGHTNLSAQKIGEYDKARDMRRPDRFVRLDLVTNTLVEEHEIEDVLAFAQVNIVRKSGPSEAAFARLSEDHSQVLLLDGIDERELPLVRTIHLYDPESLRSLAVDEDRLYVGLQVDPNNAAAVQRRKPDPDDFDLYVAERKSMHGKDKLASRKALTLPGGGRRVGFMVGGGSLAVLRKDKGFDRGGVAIELYAIP